MGKLVQQKKKLKSARSSLVQQKERGGPSCKDDREERKGGKGIPKGGRTGFSFRGNASGKTRWNQGFHRAEGKRRGRQSGGGAPVTPGARGKRDMLNQRSRRGKKRGDGKAIVRTTKVSMVGCLLPPPNVDSVIREGGIPGKGKGINSWGGKWGEKRDWRVKKRPL